MAPWAMRWIVISWGLIRLKQNGHNPTAHVQLNGLPSRRQPTGRSAAGPGGAPGVQRLSSLRGARRCKTEVRSSSWRELLSAAQPRVAATGSRSSATGCSLCGVSGEAMARRRSSVTSPLEAQNV